MISKKKFSVIFINWIEYCINICLAKTNLCRGWKWNSFNKLNSYPIRENAWSDQKAHSYRAFTLSILLIYLAPIWYITSSLRHKIKQATKQWNANGTNFTINVHFHTKPWKYQLCVNNHLHLIWCLVVGFAEACIYVWLS